MRVRVESNRARQGAKWIPLAFFEKMLPAGQAAATIELREGNANSQGTGETAGGAHYLDPTETPRLRLVVSLFVNDTAPTSTFTFQLRPLGNPKGAASSTVANDSAQVALAAPVIAFVAPAANSKQRTIVEFDCPAADHYVLDEVISVASIATNSSVVARARIDALA